ncbi:MAG: hydrogenase iron-sulfur subunit [Candidatus Helarchaeota archaeon]|nr:hydrogenase iron-sulfur subunit [Candidatus Helarchaeota archaeon]
MSKSSEFTPRIVAFLCNWCGYAGADLAGVSRFQYPATIRIIRIMCSGRVQPSFILEAFKDGTDGVLVCGCHIGDCHYISGNEFCESRFQKTLKILMLLGIDPRRVRLEWVSAAEGIKFSHVVTDFTDTLKDLGPFEPS